MQTNTNGISQANGISDFSGFMILVPIMAIDACHSNENDLNLPANHSNGVLWKCAALCSRALSASDACYDGEARSNMRIFPREWRGAHLSSWTMASIAAAMMFLNGIARHYNTL